MRPIWVIEANIDGLPTESLAAEIARQGMACHVVKRMPFASFPKDIAGAESIPRDACVIFRGTPSLLRHIQATRRWTPTAWCDFDRLQCSTYYAYFGSYLLNRDYALLPYAEVVRSSDNLFERYGVDGRIFLRPNSVDKLFSGAVVDEMAFATRFTSGTHDPTMLALVARPQRIYDEWRLIIAGGRVVAGGRYRDADGRSEEPHYPDEVGSFANGVLNAVDWRPAPVFVMDVCAADDGLRVLELNSFGCSSHYAADPTLIVEAASRIAVAAW